MTLLGQRSRLASVALADGPATEIGGNQPVRLDDPDSAWFVEQGALDVFLVEQNDDEVVSSPRHVLRVMEGGLAFGVAETGVSLIAFGRGLPESKIRRVASQRLLEEDCAQEVAAQADWWVSQFSTAVASLIEPRPRTDVLLDPGCLGEPLEAEAGVVLSARSSGVLWVSAEPLGAIAYLGTERPVQEGTGLVPLNAAAWLTVQGPGRIMGVSSLDLQRDGRLLDALADFHFMALAAEHFNDRLLLADEINEQTARVAHRRGEADTAKRNLFSVVASARDIAEATESELLAALRVVGTHEGIDFRSPTRKRTAHEADLSLADVLEASGVRGRKVSLLREDRWWSGDSGAMLAFLEDGGSPVALLPSKVGRYRVVDPASDSVTRVGAARAGALCREAWCFYRPLPADRPVGSRDIARLAGKGSAADLLRFSLAGLLVSSLTLLPSLAIGALARWVLPTGARSMLPQIVVALVVVAFIGMLLQMLQGTAMMRIEGRVTARITAALWDRVLRLPTSFFKKFTVGDLMTRLFAIVYLRDQVSGVVSHAMFSFLFLVPTLGLLFVYDVALALISLAIGTLSLLVTAVFGMLQYRPQRRRYAAARTLAGDMLQYINGIGKLRSAGAEDSAFASWARVYREQHLARIQAQRLNEHLIALASAVPGLASAALFAGTLWRGVEQITVGDFLVIHAVSTTFFVTMTGFGQSFQVIAAVVPAYAQLDELLGAVPESEMSGTTVVELEGDLRLDHVSFEYSSEGPRILDDVSIRARPGEFIALVGESGAGKSTLLRLALGLEEPSAGGVYYDGQEMGQLDKRSVRRQVGVVTQNGGLRPGDILDNIVGVGGVAGDLSIDDAWRAAKLAAVDGDIKAMPMGMFTPVSGTSSTFSGGQVQRIRIAAALVRNPRIVFLDEATNWLDTKSQSTVMAGVESLSATRVVIAHRLSTIRKADRIYMLEAGRIAQEGRFEELFNVDGPFRRLVLRQTSEGESA